MDLKLETKFIEGTNNQYSIRNDGVIISHKTNKELRPNKNGKVSLSMGARRLQKTCTITRLLKEYFEGVKCHHCDNLVKKPYSKVCDICYKIQRKRNSTPELRKRYPEKTKIKDAINGKKRIENMPKNYVASILGMSSNVLSNELYEQHRATLLVKRLLAQKLNCSIQKLV
jgi:hypothetical protein